MLYNNSTASSISDTFFGNNGISVRSFESTAPPGLYPRQISIDDDLPRPLREERAQVNSHTLSAISKYSCPQQITTSNGIMSAPSFRSAPAIMIRGTYIWNPGKRGANTYVFGTNNIFVLNLPLVSSKVPLTGHYLTTGHSVIGPAATRRNELAGHFRRPPGIYSGRSSNYRRTFKNGRIGGIHSSVESLSRGEMDQISTLSSRRHHVSPIMMVESDNVRPNGQGPNDWFDSDSKDVEKSEITWSDCARKNYWRQVLCCE